MGQIIDAISYESAVEIIPEGTVIGMPISLGGDETGRRVTKNTNLKLTSIRMSHTGPGNVYQPAAICLEPPDMSRILLPDNKVARIAVFDGIMETVGTLYGLMTAVNSLVEEHNLHENTQYPFPAYSFFILVDKAQIQPQLANLHSAFKASHQIWYHGAGADDKSPEGEERGREKPAIWGRLPDNFTGPLPQAPFYTQNF